MPNPYSYQDIVQPVARFSWEPLREHEPARDFVAASTQYATVVTSSVPVPPMTFACFFNLNDLSTNYAIMSAGDSGQTQHWFDMRIVGASNDALSVSIRGGGSPSNATSTTDIVAGKWEHGIVEYASTTSRTVWLNNRGEGTATTSVTPNTPNKVSVGARASSANSTPIDGQIFWPCIWNVVLNDAERARLAAGTPPWWILPESIVACPDLETLYDPFLEEPWTNNGSTITSPYRDWTIPDYTAIWGSTVGAPAADTITKIAGSGGLAGGHRLAGDGGMLAA